MVEAVCTGVPILYMHNKEYDEPLTPAIQPIIGTYYQGTGFEEMKEFVVQCQQGEDPLREKRIQAFRENIPYFDGKCGERIKDHIADALEKENENPLMERLDQLQYEIDNLGKKVEMLIETYKGEDNRTVQ